MSAYLCRATYRVSAARTTSLTVSSRLSAGASAAAAGRGGAAVVAHYVAARGRVVTKDWLVDYPTNGETGENSNEQ